MFQCPNTERLRNKIESCGVFHSFAWAKNCKFELVEEHIVTETDTGRVTLLHCFLYFTFSPSKEVPPCLCNKSFDPWALTTTEAFADADLQSNPPSSELSKTSETPHSLVKRWMISYDALNSSQHCGPQS